MSHAKKIVNPTIEQEYEEVDLHIVDFLAEARKRRIRSIVIAYFDKDGRGNTTGAGEHMSLHGLVDNLIESVDRTCECKKK